MSQCLSGISFKNCHEGYRPYAQFLRRTTNYFSQDSREYPSYEEKNVQGLITSMIAENIS